MQHLTCWIALDDANEENGCLHYIPQSHEWDLLPITGLAGDMESIKSVLKPLQYDKFTPIPVPLKKGYATFHHPLTIHGSFENRSAFPRRAVVLNVFLDGTFSSSDEPLLKGVPPVPKGQSLNGQFFPLLFDGKTIQA
jgi:ectoine hydroxylase-related dioxygenase (phytanoyl-CoA dioxygenase family)